MLRQNILVQNTRFTFCGPSVPDLAVLGRWRERVVQVVALDDPLVLPPVYQLTADRSRTCSPRLPWRPWFSRDVLESIEDGFRANRNTLIWSQMAKKLAEDPQLRSCGAERSRSTSSTFSTLAAHS